MCHSQNQIYKKIKTINLSFDLDLYALEKNISENGTEIIDSKELVI